MTRKLDIIYIVLIIGLVILHFCNIVTVFTITNAILLSIILLVSREMIIEINKYRTPYERFSGILRSYRILNYDNSSKHSHELLIEFTHEGSLISQNFYVLLYRKPKNGQTYTIAYDLKKK
jgi:hypothetical protein